jgi:hypothetical protein
VTQSRALEILKTGANVFLTGEPGSGKTHTVNAYVRWLRARGIEPSVTASTGIAATHIGGMTIHAWSGIGVKESLSERDLDQLAQTERVVRRVGKAKVLIIDEVSMLAARTLTMVDAACRAVRRSDAPFGGLQVVLVGDFFQLPPVVKRNFSPERAYEEPVVSMTLEGMKAPEALEDPGLFAYRSRAWAAANPIVCYLHEQHRQEDADFLEVLTAVRCRSCGPELVARIATRTIGYADAPPGVPRLFPRNIDVDRINDDELGKISGEERIYDMESSGPEPLVVALRRGCLSPDRLALKRGAAVMFTKNDQSGAYANGTLGEVVGFSGANFPLVRTKAGRTIEVEPADWKVEENGKVRASITQLPLRLAWAITVHKSQGMSLDAAVVDLSGTFEHGQGYVALSRVRALSGLYLLGWSDRALSVHPEVVGKDDEFRDLSAEADRAFEDLHADEILKMHRQFVLANGGDWVAEGSAEEADGEARAATRRGPKTPKPKKGDTLAATLALLDGNPNLAQMAEARGVSVNTVLDHLEKLRADGRLTDALLSRLVAAEGIGQSAIQKMRAAFAAASPEEGRLLRPAFDRLGGAYPFEHLRLARMGMP